MYSENALRASRRRNVIGCAAWPWVKSGRIVLPNGQDCLRKNVEQEKGDVRYNQTQGVCHHA
jgi:hypothetical protein